MTDIRCGTCRHYDPSRNPETGRIRPSEGGRCWWVHPAQDDPLPSCMRDVWRRGEEPRLGHKLALGRTRCTAHTGTDCKCWEGKK